MAQINDDFEIVKTISGKKTYNFSWISKPLNRYKIDKICVMN